MSSQVIVKELRAELQEAMFENEQCKRKFTEEIKELSNHNQKLLNQLAIVRQQLEATTKELEQTKKMLKTFQLENGVKNHIETLEKQVEELRWALVTEQKKKSFTLFG